MKLTDKKQLLHLLEEYRDEASSAETDSLIRSIRNSISKTRKAGRKPKYSDETIQKIRAMREEGATIRVIAKATGCSIGYVQQYAKDRSRRRKK